MYIFSKPRYLRSWTDPVTNKVAPAYQFDITSRDENEVLLCFLLESDVPLTTKAVEEAVKENLSEWRTFLQKFLTATTSYFSRPYTVAHLERILCHAEVSCISHVDPSLPRRVGCSPSMFHFSSNTLRIHWSACEMPAGIALPEEEEDVPPVLELTLPSEESSSLHEWDADTLPEQATDASPTLLGDPAMLLERQRVKEARLRAKLAVYRAQYQMNRYYDKYGDELSESDNESDEDEQEEEEEEGPFL